MEKIVRYTYGEDNKPYSWTHKDNVGKYIITIDSEYVYQLTRQYNWSHEDHMTYEKMFGMVYKEICDFIKGDSDGILVSPYYEDHLCMRKIKGFTIQRLSGPRIGKKLKKLFGKNKSRSIRG